MCVHFVSSPTSLFIILVRHFFLWLSVLQKKTQKKLCSFFGRRVDQFEGGHGRESKLRENRIAHSPLTILSPLILVSLLRYSPLHPVYVILHLSFLSLKTLTDTLIYVSPFSSLFICYNKLIRNVSSFLTSTVSMDDRQVNVCLFCWVDSHMSMYILWYSETEWESEQV